MEEFRIGSRGSRLAVIQSELVRNYLEGMGIRTRIITIQTKGDKILDRPLELVGGKGLFIRELEVALREGRIDLSVHSLKDVTMEVPEDLPLIGFSHREDPRDVLVLPKGISELVQDKPIGCSSRRRILQAEKLFPDMTFASVRGNVETRLAKLDRGEFSALILAAAGLKRLGLSERISRYFTVEEMIPSAGQGILALQGRADREYKELHDYFHKESALAAACERAAVSCLAGDCTAPVAAYAEVREQEIAVYGMYGGEGGRLPVVEREHGIVEGQWSAMQSGTDRDSHFVTACIRGNREEPEKLGRELAEILMEKYRSSF